MSEAFLSKWLPSTLDWLRGHPIASVLLVATGLLLWRPSLLCSLWKIKPRNKRATTPPIHTEGPSIPSRTDYSPPFRTQGRHILDSREDQVKLASINWYGASDTDYVPGGLEVQHRDEIARLIRKLGFNSVRLPYADEIVINNPHVDAKMVAANKDLFHDGIPPRAMEVFHAVVESLTNAGLLVIVNNHITQAVWCCGINPCDLSWHNDQFGGKWLCRIPQTEEGWIENWETVMRPLVSNPLVIGADLRNEVRGLWGTMSWDQWATAAEKASERLLALNPEWLMIVEGISSANDLSGVRQRPVQLSLPGRVVYSAHVYKWSGWGSLRPFGGRSYEDFAAEMWKNWGYLLAEDIAPVWVGEFGTPERPSEGDSNYWRHLIQFLALVDTSWGYWALNARKATGEWESYGLVGEEWNWPSVRWDYRLDDLRRLGLSGRK